MVGYSNFGDDVPSREPVLECETLGENMLRLVAEPFGLENMADGAPSLSPSSFSKAAAVSNKRSRRPGDLDRSRDEVSEGTLIF